MHESISDLLRDGAQQLGVALDDAAINRLLGYIELLLKWNRRVDLTGHKTADGIANRLILDSLAPAALFQKGASIIDVGSGGGVPGIPIKIARPDLRITLLEPRQRRAAFLRQTVDELKIDAMVVEARMETISDRYDIALSRALMPPKDWVRAAQKLVNPGGVIGVWEKTPTVSATQTICYYLPDGYRGVVELVSHETTKTQVI